MLSSLKQVPNGGGALTAVLGSIIPIAGTFAGGLLGAAAGGEGAHLLYEYKLHNWVVENAGKLFNTFGATNLYSSLTKNSSAAASPFVSAPDESTLVRFDADWYLSTYDDAASAVANGTAGSAYAYFLTVGIDKGEQPNASQHLARADLPFSILNNDPLALGNSALMAQPLAATPETVCRRLRAALPPQSAPCIRVVSSLAVDGTLSAIANRKVTDLIANFSNSAAQSALTHSDSAWASEWSNSNGLTQQFREALESVFGANVPDVLFKMFVVASSSASAADVIHQLQAQTDFAAALGNAGMNTLGIPEFGGVWVVIVASPVSGYHVTAPGSDGLGAITEYGGQNDDTLFAGSRPAHLYGLDGNDTLVGGVGQDYLAGGAGDDIYVVNEAQDRVIEAAGEGRDTVFSTVSYSLPADAEIEILTAYDPNGTAPINLTGNSFGQEIFGNAGANVLDGGAGNDVLIGGAGTDIARFHSVQSANVIVAYAGTVAVFNPANHETDWMQQIETLQFDNASLQTAALPRIPSARLYRHLW